jgi:hypothetical protein
MAEGTRCTCGAGHETFGACLRAKNIRVAYCQSASGKDATAQKRWDAELQAYRDATAQGIEPAGTSMSQVRHAVEKSNETGTAFNAGGN